MKRGRIYCVHYGANFEVTDNFITSLKPFLSENLELVIINNSIGLKIDRLRYENVLIFNSLENSGYFGGIKNAMVLEPVDDCDYVMLCNNDILINTPHFFRILDEKLNTWDVIAPSTKTVNGVEQNPHRSKKPSKLRKFYYRIYFSGYIFAWIFEKFYDFRKSITSNIDSNLEECEIFSPHGACIILNSTYFKKGGFIDDEYFLYGEEDSIAAIADRLKLKVGFVPDLKLLHMESASTGKSISNKKYLYKKSAYKYIKSTYKSIYD